MASWTASPLILIFLQQMERRYGRKWRLPSNNKTVSISAWPPAQAPAAQVVHPNQHSRPPAFLEAQVEGQQTAAFLHWVGKVRQNLPRALVWTRRPGAAWRPD